MNESQPFGKPFVDQIVDHPWDVLLVGVILMMALTSGGRKVQQDFTYRVWFDADDPLLQQFDAFERRFGNDERAIIIVHSPSGIFDEDSAKLLLSLTEKVWKVEDVIRVTSLSNHAWVRSEVDGECSSDCVEDGHSRAECKDECSDLLISDLIPDPEDEPWVDGLLAARRAAALADENLPSYLVSEDGNSAMIYATLRPAFTESDLGEIVMKPVDYDAVVLGLDAAVDELKDTGDHVFYQSGSPMLNHSFKLAASEDMGNLAPVALALIVLFLVVIFRRLSGVLLPLVVMFFSVITTIGTAGWIGIPISNTTSMVVQILIAIAVADSVHVLHTWFHALGLGVSRTDSARHALQKNLVPTLLTSATTAVGFFSFSQAAVVPIGDLGVLAGTGTLIAWGITYLIFGPLIVVLPIKPKTRSGADVDLEAISPGSRRLAGAVVRYRRAITGLFVAVAVGSVALALDSEVTSDPFDYFPKGSRLNVAMNFFEANVGGALPVEMVVSAQEEGGFKDPEWLARVQVFQSWLEEKPFVSSAVSIIDILQSMNRSIHGDDPKRYVLPDTTDQIAQLKLLYEQGLPPGTNINDRVPIQEDAIRITGTWTLHDSKTVLTEMDAIIAEGEERGLDVEITGKAQLWQRMNPYLVDTFVTSLAIALIVMTLLLSLVFRSWKLGLLAMIPNGVPLLIGGAMLNAVGKPLDIWTVVVFSVCLGIAVDDTIHFLANYDRLRRGGASPRAAVEGVFSHTMPALCITTAILVAAFGIFVFASFVPNMWFGVLVAFVLSMALLTDATLLPALLASRDTSPAPSDPAP